MMRIITGKARGVRLAAPQGDLTRPTSERAKEAVFSMLQFEISGAEVLDLFAGSGQMGLESLSRGASRAVFCDRDASAISVIRSNSLKTKLAPQCEIYASDYTALLKRFQKKRTFDLVFLDPPYALGAIPRALRQLREYGLLRDGAKIVCESADTKDVFGEDASLQDCFESLRVSHYGIAFVTVLQYHAEEVAK